MTVKTGFAHLDWSTILDNVTKHFSPNILQRELQKAKQKAFREQEGVNKSLGVSTSTYMCTTVYHYSRRHQLYRKYHCFDHHLLTR